jgi:hypothetical protein
VASIAALLCVPLPSDAQTRRPVAMMVLADRAWGWFRESGASGVWNFFALSGFLPVRPYARDPVAASRWSACAAICSAAFAGSCPCSIFFFSWVSA